MSYFKGVAVGDLVYDLVYGWGKVEALGFEEIGTKYDGFRVYFADIKSTKEYLMDGRLRYFAINQTLFWDEVSFEIPKNPKIDQERYDKVEKDLEDDLIYTRWESKEKLNKYLKDKYDVQGALEDVDKNGLVGDYAFIISINKDWGGVHRYLLS